MDKTRLHNALTTSDSFTALFGGSLSDLTLVHTRWPTDVTVHVPAGETATLSGVKLVGCAATALGASAGARVICRHCDFEGTPLLPWLLEMGGPDAHEYGCCWRRLFLYLGW